MNIVKFWEDQVNKWNEESKCGLCWTFGAPLVESKINIQQFEEDKECCVKVFFLQDKQPAFSTSNTYSQTGFVNQIVCNKNFQLLVLFDSNLGLNMYNEIKDHPTSESVWSDKLSVLQDCLACDAQIDFCEIIGQSSRITQWSGQQVINYLSSTYVGYRISVTFQDVK